MTEHLHTARQGGLGIITLNRPGALNSLSLDMVRALRAALDAWRHDEAVHAVLITSSSERAFCAGGDIRFFYDAARGTAMQGAALLEDFFTEEYALNYVIATYPKPYIALMNGVIMGGGMGIAETGRFRVVTDNTKMAMPEVNIGLFPDVGGTYFLSRAPGEIGTYLGLTGEIIGPADALYCGMADAYLPYSEFAGFAAALSDSTSRTIHAPFGPKMLEKAHEYCVPFQRVLAPEQSTMAHMRSFIDWAFHHDSVAAILEALEQKACPEYLEFSQKTAATMRKRSPLLMAVTLEALRRATTMSLAQCLRMERNLVRRTFEHGEVVEGVRALVIDKDNAPQWNPPQTNQVTAAMVARFFEPCWPTHLHPLATLEQQAPKRMQGVAPGNRALMIDITLAPGTRDAVVELIVRNGHESLAYDPGCLAFEVMQHESDANRIVIHEVWQNQAALEAHWNTERFKAYRAARAALGAADFVKRVDTWLVPVQNSGN
jgi:enoyl-CoA hydratase/carnithine racemase/quinol monooxygenase YgiN